MAWSWSWSCLVTVTAVTQDAPHPSTQSQCNLSEVIIYTSTDYKIHKWACSSNPSLVWSPEQQVKCTTGEPRFHALIIPGNPGAAGYYTSFMQSLYDLFDQSIDLTAVSALGIGVGNTDTSKASLNSSFPARSTSLLCSVIR